jgi:phospholipid N-methyltransferase
MDNNIEFFREGLKNLRTVGSIARSSQFLCREMVSHVNFRHANCIVELGAGDGVITEHILKRMKPDAKLLSFEINPQFTEKLRAIDDPRLIVIEDSAEKIGEYLAKYHLKHTNYVLSALPFLMLPDALADKIVGEAWKYLRKDGLFIQFHYSPYTKKRYQQIFGNVEIHFAPINIPPAFVLTCRKMSI